MVQDRREYILWQVQGEFEWGRVKTERGWSRVTLPY